MRSRIFFEVRSIKDALMLTAQTVKVGRDYPDKVMVRACLPVIWVYGI